MRLNPGQSISSSRYRYSVVRQIGEGGMSAIYLCDCSAPAGSPDAGRWVLKEMTVSYRDRKDQENAVSLFLREAQILQQLRHKNLPRVLEQFVLDVNGTLVTGAGDGPRDRANMRYYTVMEFVEGEDLGKLLLRNPQGFPEQKAVAWAIEIATVLYYLHSQKPPIIFRDLKPSNIMISRGQVRLIDFGIARRFDAFKKKDTVRIGSPGYAPPEQYSGQTDRRSDIYALGVTLHQLLTGRDPSETQTPFKLPMVRSLAPAVSPATEAIVMRATELDPQARFKNALDMKRALQAILGVQSQPLQTLPLGAPGARPAGGGVSSPAAPARPAGGAQSVPPRIGPPALGGSSTVPNASNPYAPQASPTRQSASTPASQAGSAQGRQTASPGAQVVAPAASSAPPPRGVASPAPADASTAATSAGTVAPASAAGGGATPSPVASGLATVTMPAPTAGKPLGRGRAFMLALLATLVGAISVFSLSPGLLDALIRRLEASFSRPYTGSSSSPTALASAAPAAAPTPSLAQQALKSLDEGNLEAAFEQSEKGRKSDRSDALALVAQSNALVRVQSADGLPTLVVQAIYVDDAYGREWLRGVAQAQRDANARGGLFQSDTDDPKVVHQYRIALLADPVIVETGRPERLVESAQQQKAIASLIDLPDRSLAPFANAFAQARMTAVTGAPGAVDRPDASGPSLRETEGAYLAAIAALKPKRLAIVLASSTPAPTAASSSSPASSVEATPSPTSQPTSAPSVEARGEREPTGADPLFEQAVRRVVPQTQVFALKPDGSGAEALASFHPGVVVFRGSARALDRFVSRGSAALSGVTVVSGPQWLGPRSDTPQTVELARAGRLLVVTPYRPDSDDLDAWRFSAAYRRTFAVTEGPGFAAAQGYEMLDGLLRRFEHAHGALTLDSARQAVSEAKSPPHTFGGARVGQIAGPDAVWYLLSFKSGAVSVVREVKP